MKPHTEWTALPVFRRYSFADKLALPEKPFEWLPTNYGFENDRSLDWNLPRGGRIVGIAVYSDYKVWWRYFELDEGRDARSGDIFRVPAGRLKIKVPHR